MPQQTPLIPPSQGLTCHSDKRSKQVLWVHGYSGTQATFNLKLEILCTQEKGKEIDTILNAKRAT